LLLAESKLLRRMQSGSPKIIAPPYGIMNSSKTRIGYISQLWKGVGAAISAIAFVIGIASGYYGLKAKISIAPTAAVNPNDPFQSAFVVKNESPFSIKDVKLDYFINYASESGIFLTGV
jgi:hypothetical protein